MRIYLSIILVLVFGNNLFSQSLKSSILILESKLPIIVIDAGYLFIPDDPKINAKMGIINNDGSGLNQLYTSFNADTILVGIETRGQSSQYFYPKKSYGLETRDADGENLNLSILGLPKENDWILYGPYGDKTMIRNKLVYDLAGKVMEWAPNLIFCELVIDNSYQGIYLFGEKIKRDKNRVDISKLNEEDISGDDLTGGYILKIDKGDQNGVTGWYSEHLPASSNRGKIYFQYHYPKFDEIMPEQMNYIQNFMKDFENTLKGPNFKDPVLGYQAYIDSDSFIDFFIINEICKNIDSYRLSTFFYKDKDSNDPRLKMGPVWDFNLAFGNANYCHGEESSGWAYKYNEACPDDYWLVPFWWDRLMEDPLFQNKLKTRWAELRKGPLSNSSIFSMINGYVSELDDAISRNYNKWPVFGEWVWPNYFVGNSYQEEIDYMKDWIDNRLRFMDYYMPGEILTGNPQILLADIYNVYPNPFKESFTVDSELNIEGPWEIKIFTSSGKMIMKELISSLPASISLSNYSTGLYSYQISNNSEIIAKGRLIKN